MKTRNLDCTQYVIRDPADWNGDAFITTNINDAFEHWASDPDRFQALEYNLAEHSCDELTDDFRDWQDENRIEAAAVRRHERSYAVGTM